GVVYKITPAGKGAVFYKTNATHVTALAVDRSGSVFAGTASPGRVLKLAPDGKPFVLMDPPFQEVHVLRFDDKGLLYVGALSARPGGPAPADAQAGQQTGASQPSVSVEVTSVVVGDAGSRGSGSGNAREERRNARGAVFRITPDGVWDQIWETRE